MKEIIADYKNSLQRLVENFICKHFSDDNEDFELDYNREVWYDGDSIFEYNDIYFRISDILISLEQDVPQGTFFEWYYYSIECDKKDYINFSHWVMGLRPETIAEYKAKQLAESKAICEKSKEELLKELDRLEDKHDTFYSLPTLK